MRTLLLLALLCCCSLGRAQTCGGGLYLNPQVIRGELSNQAEAALQELTQFLRATPLSVVPVININATEDVLQALRQPQPPCWIYGNPVVGLASGYRPLLVNTKPIQSAVLVLGDAGAARNPAPIQFSTLAPAQQAKVLAGLKQARCFGMKGGVTTSLVKAAKLCGAVIELVPQHGLGQSFLPTKVAFEWRPDRWVGLISRLSSIESSFVKNAYQPGERVHNAQPIIVPVAATSWGYGLYLHPSVPMETRRRVMTLFQDLRNPSRTLMRALDLEAGYDFSSPEGADIEAMKKSLVF